MYAYVVLSLLTGARTEELRALTWTHVDLDGDPTPTRRSRRTSGLALRPGRRRHQDPQVPPHPGPAARCVDALREHRERQARRGARRDRLAGQRSRLRLRSRHRLDAANVRRGFRRIAKAAGLNAADWTPASCGTASSRCCPTTASRIEKIARLVGHSGTAVTETVYRKQLRPVLDDGATAMDRIFASRGA